MQKTPLRQLPEDLPDRFWPLVQAAAVYDSSCSPQAQVLYLDRDGGYYLKRANRGRLEPEARMARFYHAKGLGRPLTLHVYRKNPRALAFYLREGFTIQGRRVDPGTGQEELVLGWA